MILEDFLFFGYYLSFIFHQKSQSKKKDEILVVFCYLKCFYAIHEKTKSINIYD